MLLTLTAACGGDPGAPPTRATDVRAEFEAIADRLEQGSNLYHGRGRLAQLEKRLQRANITDDRRATAWPKYCRALLQFGQERKATEEVDRAIEWFAAEPARAAALPDLYRLRGIAFMRLAEVENCIRLHNAECCILPLRGGGRHVEREPALEARESFEAYLAARPGATDAIWILTLLDMALGENGGTEPRPDRIPGSAWASDHEIERFVDVAQEAGVAAVNLCGGAITEDFDGDGHLDILTSTSDPRGALTQYRGGPGMHFEDVSADAGIEGQLGGLNCMGGDYDDDGDVDVLVLRGAWLFDDGQIRNSLLENDGDGRFRDVTAEAGLSGAFPTQAACWGDFDGDGRLDLYVVNESRLEIGPPVGDFPAQLFIKDADGRFVDRARSAGVTNDRYAKGVAAGDYDNDGDLDLYVSNIGANRLYRNEGDGTFRDVAESLGVADPQRSFAAWFFDYDNDGWLDLFVAGFRASLRDVADDYLGRPDKAERPRLYRNEGGTFRDVTIASGLDHAYLPMGANFGDIDNDGYLDIYLATGDPDFETLTPNVMLRNDAGRTFQDVTTAGGFGHLQKGHGVAFADLDNDGDQDIYNQLGGFYPADRFANALFENPGHGGHFLYLSLVGTRSNRSATGARIEVRVREGEHERSIHRAVGSVSSFGGSPARQEIGLGDAQEVEWVEVVWPRGDRLRYTGCSADRWFELREGDPTVRERPLG